MTLASTRRLHPFCRYLPGHLLDRATLTYWCGFGLHPDQKIVFSAGMATRNIGAAVAPLFSIGEIDQPAIVMLVLIHGDLGLSARWFGRPARMDRSDFAADLASST
jgi:hypothetical protein